MSFLKKVLYSLIAVLVFVVGGGLAYLQATGNMAHITGGHQTAASSNTTPNTQPNQGSSDTSNQANSNQPDMNMNGSNQQQTGTDSQNQMNMADNSGNQTGVNGQQGSNAQQGVNGQQGTNGQQIAPALPPIRVINPEPYYDKLSKAQEIIDEANKMITVDPFTADGKSGTMSTTDMSKLHQGIYKMSQGVTAMKETLDSLNSDIKGETQFGINPYQQYGYQAAPGASYAIPYPSYNYPQAYGYPQANYPQVNGYPYNYPQQGQPNTQVQPYAQGQQTTQDQNNAQGHTQVQQTPQTTDQTHTQAGTQHNSTQASSLDLQSKNIMLYAIYGVLTVSIIAVFVSIFGILKGLLGGFTNTNKNAQAGGNVNA